MLTALRDGQEARRADRRRQPAARGRADELPEPADAHGLVGGGTALADDFLQIRLGGDLALFQALGHLLLEAEDGTRGRWSTRLHRRTDRRLRGVCRGTRASSTGTRRRRPPAWAASEIAGWPRLMAGSKATIVCWAMGLTQHQHSVATIREIVNLLLLQGNSANPAPGLPGARPLQRAGRPHDGHLGEDAGRSWPPWTEFGFSTPREHGYDTVDDPSRACGTGGGRLRGAGRQLRLRPPRHRRTEAGAASGRADRAGLHQAQPLPTSCTAGPALILPTLGRTDRDDRHPGGGSSSPSRTRWRVVHASRAG